MDLTRECQLIAKVCLSVFLLSFNIKVLIENLCHIGPETDLFAGEIPWVILIAVSSLLVISACIVGLAICICRRNTTRNPPQQSVQCKNLIII